jgi:hypothetical protein
MDKRGQGGSELHVQEKWRIIPHRQDFAKYLRENSAVKG